MTLSSLMRLTVASLASAAVFIPSALAGGEPKNEPPFTRPVAERSAQGATRPVIRHEQPIQGEAKNELPFTRPATIVVTNSSGSGFNWTDGALGALAGVGIALAGAGAVLVARKSPQTA